MNHFSYYLRHISKQAPSYIQISNHIFEKYPFGSNSKACYDIKETNSKIIKQRFK